MATLQELFAQYEIADQHWLQKKVELEQATGQRSDIVKAISTIIHPKKRILYKGREITIVVRPSKDGSSITYFFRGMSSSDDVAIVE